MLFMAEMGFDSFRMQARASLFGKSAVMMTPF